MKIINKPYFLNDNILKDVINKIYLNKKIKDIKSISFCFKDKINKSLIYSISIECSEKITYIDGVEVLKGNDIIIHNIVFRKDENYKAYLYW